MRLLLVEDNLINQQVAQELLSAEGARVELAANGQLGVAAVAAARPPFDAVLMDLQMPVMDGYSATRAIRQELGLTDLPVIAMTANAMDSDREACLAAGMNDHVGKPFDLSHLVKVLLSHIRRAPACDPQGGTEGAMATLPPADSVDLDVALARLGGNIDLYVRILQSYLGEIAIMPDQLDGLLQRGDLSGAADLFHTLKGISATVGASHLAALARAAERAVKGANATLELPDLRASFRVAVTGTGHLMAQVAQRLQAPPAPDPASAARPDPDRLLADLRELQALLRSSDLRALEVQARLRPALAGIAAAELAALNAAVADLDFPRAVVQCQALLQQLSPPI